MSAARGMIKKHVPAEAGSPSSKAAAFMTRGAYSQFVSTAKGRERRWRLFSTFPLGVGLTLEKMLCYRDLRCFYINLSDY